MKKQQTRQSENQLACILCVKMWENTLTNKNVDCFDNTFNMGHGKGHGCNRISKAQKEYEPCFCTQERSLSKHMDIFLDPLPTRRNLSVRAHRTSLLEEKPLHPRIGCDTMSHFVGTQKQKGYRAFDSHSRQLLELWGKESHPKANILVDNEEA